MARKIAWKDLRSLTRFKNQKSILDNSFQYVYNPGLLSSSLLSIISPQSGFFTAVEPIQSGEPPFILGQIYHPAGEFTARIVFLAPGDLDARQAYGNVFSQMAVMAGERGAVQVKAEVNTSSAEEHILTLSGYRSYADQQIWKLPRRMVLGTGKQAWVPITKNCVGLAKTFYQRIVPGQVQRVEPPPEAPDIQGLISWKEGRIVGFASTQFGPRGILVDIQLSPELDQIDQYLSALLFHLPYRDSRDVFFRVRSYQQRIASTMERIGSEAGPEQKVMVKRLAVHYNAKQTFRVQGFENQPDITTPISNTEIKN